MGDRFTGADIMLGYGLNLARMLGALADDYPNVTAYLERLSDRPAFQRAYAETR